MKPFFTTLIFIIGIAALSCHAPHAATAAARIKTLKETYKNYFPIGVAVGAGNLGGAEAQLILEQFNSLTPENAMKMGPIHPEEGRYEWKVADSIVAFAQRHGLKVRGHNLCWHEQTPKWMFTDSSGKPMRKDVLLQRLKNHITTVVSRYKGKVYAWDVVNEAIDDDPDAFLQTSCGTRSVVRIILPKHLNMHTHPTRPLFFFTMIIMKQGLTKGNAFTDC